MASTRSALIIANDNYADVGLRSLRAPAYDAESLGAVLQDPQVGDFDVRTLLNEPAHEAALAIEEFFADRAPDDLLLMHISCHGVKDEGGELYFAASNTQVRRLGATAIAADFVNRCMGRSRSRRVVLLLDCCYAGAFERGMVARAGSTVAIEEQLGGRGRAVITASSAMEYAFEDGDLSDANELSPSVFTSALVEGLQTGDADRDQDGVVGLDELYDYVYEKVRSETPNQTPGKWVFGVHGDLVIARRARPVTSPAPLNPELQEAIASPFAAVRIAVIPELARIMRGRHAGQALAARQTLEHLTQDDSRSVSEAAAEALDAAAVTDSGPTAFERDTAPLQPEPAPPEPVALPEAVLHPKATAPAAEAVVDDKPATKPSPRPAPEESGLSRGADRTLVAAGLLVLGAAVLYLVGVNTTFASSGGTDATLWDNTQHLYVLISITVPITAGILLLAPRTQRLIGPGFLIGSVGVTASTPVFLILFPAAVPDGTMGSGYYLVLFGALVYLTAVGVAAGGVRRLGTVRVVGRVPTDWAGRVVLLLGIVAAASLAYQVSIRGNLADHTFDASVDLAPSLLDAAVALAVASVAALVLPRRFGASMLAGWIAAGASLSVYYFNTLGAVFPLCVVAMLAIVVPFARAARDT